MSNGLVRRHVAPEMLALSVVELILTFSLALIFLAPSMASVNAASVHLALISAFTVWFTAFIIGLYRPQMFERGQRLMFSSLLSALLSFPAIWIISKTFGLGDYWPVGYDSLRPLKIVIIWCLAVLSVRLTFLFAVRLNLFVHRVGVIGLIESPSVYAAVNSGRKGFLEISAISAENVTVSILASRGIRTLVIGADGENMPLQATFLDLKRHGISVQIETEFWERCLRRLDIANFENTWREPKEMGNISLSLARLFDLCVSLALLIATLPIICVVALLIRLDSTGAVLYRQERVGLFNEVFTLFKFRSMKTDAEAFGPRWAQQKDPRVTRIGSFLRRTRIDELPQLFNILRGEMSFIGPRPERPHFVEQLSTIIPFYQERARVKPGLTGWAQVNYPYGASVEDAKAKLSYDLYYVKNRTILLDLLIILSTIRVILLQEGAR